MKVRPSLILRSNDKVLLMRYNYGGHDVFGLPGGNPDDGETLADTLIRELAEELQIEVRPGSLLFAGEVFAPGKAEPTLHCVFAGDIVSGAPGVNPDQTSASAAEWVPLEELPEKNLYPNLGSAIKAHFKAQTDGADQRNPYLGRIQQDWF